MGTLNITHLHTSMLRIVFLTCFSHLYLQKVSLVWLGRYVTLIMLWESSNKSNIKVSLERIN